MTIPVKVLSISTRPNGSTVITWRAPDGRRLHYTFAPGAFDEGTVEAARQFIETHRQERTPHVRNV